VSDHAAPMNADVEAAQRGDVRAFENLFLCIQPPLLRYLTTLVGDAAADVASETWLQVTRDLSRFRGDAGDFKGWVVTIGRHRALDHLRAARRRRSDPVDPAALPAQAAADDTFGAAEEAMATQRALALIARLPRDQAEAVVLRVVVGLDAPAAAKILGKRAGAVRMATSRGLARLEELVAERHGDVEEPPGVTLPGSGAL
jgi:RNA polymerase sigma-70 factor (ECF subfamily)